MDIEENMAIALRRSEEELFVGAFPEGQRTVFRESYRRSDWDWRTV